MSFFAGLPVCGERAAPICIMSTVLFRVVSGTCMMCGRCVQYTPASRICNKIGIPSTGFHLERGTGSESVLDIANQHTEFELAAAGDIC